MTAPTNRNANPPDSPSLLSQVGSVPVFDCHVILCRSPEGEYVARSSRLAGVTGRGPTERAALQEVVAAFKQAVRQYVASGRPIPWRDPPEQPQPGESQRWIPVHL